MYNVTITHFTAKGLLKQYQVHKVAEIAALATLLPSIVPDIYVQNKWPIQEDTLKDKRGFVRAHMATTGERLIVNVAKTD